MEKITQENEERIIGDIIDIIKEKEGIFWVHNILDFLEIEYTETDIIYFVSKLKTIRLLKDMGGTLATNDHMFTLSDYGRIQLRYKKYAELGKGSIGSSSPFTFHFNTGNQTFINGNDNEVNQTKNDE